MKVSSKNWKIAHFGVLFVPKWAKMNFPKNQVIIDTERLVH